MCVERADVRYTLARDGLLDVLLSADNVLVCCWHAAIVLAFLQALWRALARGQVRWGGSGSLVWFHDKRRCVGVCGTRGVRVEKLRAHATWGGRLCESRVHTGVAKADSGALVHRAWQGLTVRLCE